jgi:Na+-transporting NADH:ubiquinone oxidoreductase subunit D
MAFFGPEEKKAFITNIWKDNPIFCQILGICSSLAVTNLMYNTIIMCVGVTAVTAGSCVLVSFLRNYIPARVRMIVEILLITALTTVVDILLKTFLYDVSKQIGPYIGLIATNCIVMGRTEVYALKNGPWLSFLDGVGAGLGYSIMLLSIAVIREILGFGTLLGYPVMNQETWVAWNIMIMPPGAFLILGVFIWIINSTAKKEEKKA